MGAVYEAGTAPVNAADTEGREPNARVGPRIDRAATPLALPRRRRLAREA
jgi:hypothetical protein